MPGKNRSTLFVLTVVTVLVLGASAGASVLTLPAPVLAQAGDFPQASSLVAFGTASAGLFGFLKRRRGF